MKIEYMQRGSFSGIMLDATGKMAEIPEEERHMLSEGLQQLVDHVAAETRAQSVTDLVGLVLIAQREDNDGSDIATAVMTREKALLACNELKVDDSVAQKVRDPRTALPGTMRVLFVLPYGAGTTMMPVAEVLVEVPTSSEESS